MGQKRGIMMKYGKQEERKHKGTTQKSPPKWAYDHIA